MRKIFKWLIAISIIILLLLFLSIKYPVYKFIGGEQGHEKLEIKGIVYVRKPDTQWNLVDPVKLIGFVEGIDKAVFRSNKINTDEFVNVRFTFNQLKGQWGIFYREGMSVPEPSADTVTSLEFQSDMNSRVVEDEELIRELFYVVAQQEKSAYIGDPIHHVGSINYYNDNLLGLFNSFSLMTSPYGYFLYDHSRSMNIAISEKLGQQLEAYFSSID